jgi:hypothetical protein
MAWMKAGGGESDGVSNENAVAFSNDTGKVLVGQLTVAVTRNVTRGAV